MKKEVEILFWCNSGKTLKQCHFEQKNMQLLSFSEEQKARKKIWNKKYCLHPRKEECDGGIIKAHTVQKAMLKQISLDSHVYTPTFKNTPNSPPEFYVKRIGVGDASVFTGFCAYHDKETFKKIEDEDFTGTEEQCFLYAYRAICRELFLKLAHKEDVEFSKTAIIRETSEQQKATEDFLDTNLEGVEAGIFELKNLKQKVDDILLSQTFDEIHYCIFWIDQYPEILCNSVFQLDFDFNGNLLQNWADVHNELDAISVSFITTLKGGAVVLAWHKSADSTCLSFIQSLFTFSNKRKPNLLVNWAVKEIENIFFSPIWWESLHPDNQQIVMEEFLDNPSLLIPRFPTYLTDGRIEGFGWEITDITSNAFSILK